MNSLLAPDKELSTASFYNSLSTLEKEGFLKFHKDKSGDSKKIEVKATLKASSLLGFLQYFLIQFSLINTNTMYTESIEIIKTLSNTDQFETTLIIEPDLNESPNLITSIIPMAVKTIKSLAIISKSIFLVSTDNLFEQYLSYDKSIDMNLSKVMGDGVIREPDKYFQLIVFPLYSKNIQYYGLNLVGILKEAKRLLTDDGMILIIHVKDIPESEHYYVQIFAENLKSSGYFTPYDSDEVIQNLENIGYQNLNSKSVNGVNYIIAHKV